MNQYIETAIKQAPVLVVTLGALIYVVRTFLLHINQAARQREEIEQSRQEIDRMRAEGIVSLGDECHAVQREATEVMAAVRVTLEANSRVLEENSQVMRQNNLCFQDFAQTHRELLGRLQVSRAGG